MGEEYEVQIKHASESIIKDQIECGIDIITDGEVRRENYIHYHCRHLGGIDFEKLTKKTARTGNYDCWLPTITNKIEFIGLDHEKNSPYDHDKIYEIINVPTIIFYKDDMEFNRIVELTIETLEKDILSILSDSGYENAYYGF